MIVWWSTFPNAVTLFLSYCHPWQWFWFPCASSCPGAHSEMLTALTMSVGEFVEEALPKAGYWQSQTPSIRELLVLGTVGTQENITKKGKHREQSSLLSETLHSHEMCWMHSYPSASTDSVLCFQLAEGAAASPRVPERAQGSAQQGRREGWSRFSPHIDPSPRGSLLHPVLHQGLLVSAALSFPAFWHA